jgi:alkylhydroperoxidase family enzyme
MHPTSPRLRPIPPEEFTAEQAAVATIKTELNFGRVFVHHPDLYRAFIPMAMQLIGKSSLPERDREILIIRALELCKGEYEAVHHVLWGRDIGMTDAEIEAARTGGPGLSPFEQVLVKAAEELVRDHCLGDETWRALSQNYSTQQMLEVIFMVGNYSTISMFTNSTGMPVEDEFKKLR